MSAEAGYIVTFGIKPVRPETGYGYIETGQKLSEADGFMAGFLKSLMRLPLEK